MKTMQERINREMCYLNGKCSITSHIYDRNNINLHVYHVNKR